MTRYSAAQETVGKTDMLCDTVNGEVYTQLSLQSLSVGYSSWSRPLSASSFELRISEAEAKSLCFM